MEVRVPLLHSRHGAHGADGGGETHHKALCGLDRVLYRIAPIDRNVSTMVFTRLSTLVAPAPLNRVSGTQTMSPSTLRRPAARSRDNSGRNRVSILAGSLTLLPVLAALSLAFLALLTPTTHLRTGLVTIRPIGQASTTSISPTSINASTTAPASASATLTLGPSIIDPSQAGDLNKTGTVLSAPIDVSNITRIVQLNATAEWYGESGPSMWIGMIQVCVRDTSISVVECAFVSHLSSFAAILPGELGPGLQNVKMSTSGPVLILLTAVALALASFVLVGSWLGPYVNIKWCPTVCAMPWARRYPKLEERDGHHRSASDSESMITLVERPDIRPRRERQRQPIPHCAFGVLCGTALVLSIIGAGLELKVVSDLIGDWDSRIGEEIGMIMELGPMTILLCCTPVLVLLALTAAYAPLLVRKCAREPLNDNQERFMGGAAVSAHQDISPLFRDQTNATQTFSDRNVDREKGRNVGDITVGVPTTRALPESGVSLGPKARASWRYTLQSLVGVAV